jgi:hypothetical protein
MNEAHPSISSGAPIKSAVEMLILPLEEEYTPGG